MYKNIRFRGRAQQKHDREFHGTNLGIRVQYICVFGFLSVFGGGPLVLHDPRCVLGKKTNIFLPGLFRGTSNF